MLRLNIVHHFLHTQQKLMTYLLMKQIIFTLQCLCTIWLNIAIIIQIHQEVYDSLKEMKFLIIILSWLLIILNHSKYKAALLGKTKDAFNNTNSFLKDAKIVVPLKFLSNFWRSLEMPLINSKVYLKLNWIEDCILSCGGDSARFAITDAKLHVPIVTLSKCKFGKTIKRRI